MYAQTHARCTQSTVIPCEILTASALVLTILLAGGAKQGAQDYPRFSREDVVPVDGEQS